MIRALFNWRTLLALLAILIVSGTIIYSQYLARKIAHEEREKGTEARPIIFIASRRDQ